MPHPAYPTIFLGDLHGRLDLLIQSLIDLGLIDAGLRWIGGTRHLIQLGDVIDRGPESLAALDLLMRLQREAADAGGRVTCLLGNHDLMALRSGVGDHNDRLTWGLNGGDAVYREWCARKGLTPADTDLPYPEEFYALFAPDGPYGKWMHTHELACRAGDYVAVHAGWTADGPESVEEANDVPFLDLPPRERLVWVRGQTTAEVDTACQRLGAQALIAGHTIVWGILVSAGGRLIQIDAGMVRTGIWVAAGLDEDGQLWALMEGTDPRPIRGDSFLPLPVDGKNPFFPPPTPRFGPGNRVRLYEAHDGSWACFLHIDAISEYDGTTFYSGKSLTQTGGVWHSQSRTWPVALVDRFGRPIS